MKNKVQAAIPIDAETIQKLTLNSPEMVAEREQFKEDEERKASVKDSLSHLYPWETRDEERDILVDECKEAIMALSSDDNNFFGPYQMPKLNVTTEETEKNEEEDEEAELEEEEDDEEKEEKPILERDPTEEAKEKLSKLEPLPPLLGEFDLDAHVGLIQKMLKIDEKLVERQSVLSGKLSFRASLQSTR